MVILTSDGLFYIPSFDCHSAFKNNSFAKKLQSMTDGLSLAVTNLSRFGGWQKVMKDLMMALFELVTSWLLPGSSP